MKIEDVIAQVKRRFDDGLVGDVAVNESLAHFSLGMLQASAFRRGDLGEIDPTGEIQSELAHWYWLGIEVDNFEFAKANGPVIFYRVGREQRVGEPAVGSTVYEAKGAKEMLGSIQFHADGLGVLIGPVTAGPDAKGNPSSIENLQVASSDESKVTVTPEGEGTWRAMQVGPLTTPADPTADPPVEAEIVQLLFTWDARVGEGEKSGSDFIACTVVSGDATSIAVAIAPEERA